MTQITKNNLTVVYYTSNWLDTQNPYFLENTKKQLLTAIGDLPLISVSQKPIAFGTNICVGEIGRSHLNLYRQILAGSWLARGQNKMDTLKGQITTGLTIQSIR